ncbi:MAG: hypothetical protein KAT05_11345 [Spirochaetes bacterium]|nr:hypothetical protein [Spirochaetota bacterium]
MKHNYVLDININENHTGNWELNDTVVSLTDVLLPLKITQIENESYIGNITTEYRKIHTKNGTKTINFNPINITLHPSENLTISKGGKIFPNHHKHEFGDIDFLTFSSGFEFYVEPIDDFVSIIKLPYPIQVNENSKRYYPFIQIGSYYHLRNYVTENFDISLYELKNKTVLKFRKKSNSSVKPDIFIIAESFPTPKVTLDIFDDIRLEEGGTIERSIKISNMQNDSLYYLLDEKSGTMEFFESGDNCSNCQVIPPFKINNENVKILVHKNRKSCNAISDWLKGPFECYEITSEYELNSGHNISDAKSHLIYNYESKIIPEKDYRIDIQNSKIFLQPDNISFPVFHESGIIFDFTLNGSYLFDEGKNRNDFIYKSDHMFGKYFYDDSLTLKLKEYPNRIYVAEKVVTPIGVPFSRNTIHLKFYEKRDFRDYIFLGLMSVALFLSSLLFYNEKCSENKLKTGSVIAAIITLIVGIITFLSKLSVAMFIFGGLSIGLGIIVPYIFINRDALFKSRFKM